MPIAYSARAHIEKGVQFHWHLRKGKPEWLDLEPVFQTLDKLGFTPSKFVYYCALRGCDHVNKQALTPRLKEAQVLADFLKLCAETPKEPVWDNTFQVQRLVCVVNPVLFNRKLYAESEGLFTAKVKPKAMDNESMMQLFAASAGSAKVRSILPKEIIDRLLSLHAMWSPDGSALPTIQ